MKDKIKVLVVEDEAIMALEICTLLDELGYSALGFVCTGKEAVEKAINDKPDIILMDISLPGNMDGVETVKKIHSTHKIPVIFITGYSCEDVQERIDEVEYAACFNKPVSIYDITEAIDKFFAENH